MNGKELFRPILYALILILGIMALAIIFFQTGYSMTIDSCTTFPQFAPTNVSVFNETDNTTSNITVYVPSTALQICPAALPLYSMNFPNMTWGYSYSGTNGTCAINLSVQQPSELFPKRIYNITLASNGSYYADDSFVTVDAKSSQFYCPICPVPEPQQICSTDYTPDIFNSSYDWTNQSSPCNVTIHIPARPYCLSDATDWLMNTSCMERPLFAELEHKSSLYDQCNASIQIYQHTYSSPQESCDLPPQKLAEGWAKLSKWERDHLDILAGMSGTGPITLENFQQASLGTASTQQEMNFNANQASFAIQDYVRVGFADFWKTNVTDQYGSHEQIIGYKVLISPNCVNLTQSTLAYGTQEKGWGTIKGLCWGIGGTLFVCFMIYWLIETRVAY